MVEYKRKPSGTVSQLVDSASGIHPRWSKYYIRTVRADNKDPLTQFMIDSGIPNEPDKRNPNDMTVFSFPMKAPKSYTRDDLSSIEHLELWKLYQENWCEHKPSITVNVKEDEWPKIGGWVYEHFNDISGVSFLPYDGHVYEQAPYQACDKKVYTELKKHVPESIDWTKLSAYEAEDNTIGMQTMSCTGDSCEIVDLI